jgi:hypothetical protein
VGGVNLSCEDVENDLKNSLCDIAMNKDVARLRAGDDGFWNPRVGAAYPQDLCMRAMSNTTMSLLFQSTRPSAFGPQRAWESSRGRPR